MVCSVLQRELCTCTLRVRTPDQQHHSTEGQLIICKTTHNDNKTGRCMLRHRLQYTLIQSTYKLNADWCCQMLLRINIIIVDVSLLTCTLTQLATYTGLLTTGASIPRLHGDGKSPLILPTPLSSFPFLTSTSFPFPFHCS